MLRLGSTLYTKTLVTDTSIYASGDQIGTGPVELQMFKFDQKVGILESITVIDKAKQDSALDFLFFGQLPTFAGSQNAAFDVTDAEAALKLLGVATVSASDYKDLASNSVASLKAIGLLLQAETTPTPPQTYRSLWLGVVARGTPTYVSASDLTIRFGLYQH